MQRRSALKSLMLAVAGGTVAHASAPPAVEVSKSSFVQSSFIETGDKTRIHFRDWGSGRPIVFVAPWGLSSDWWDIPTMSFTERGWRCITFDRRGHARSDDPSRGYDFDTLADDIAAVMDTLDLDNIVLVGHSMGGAEVARYLTRHQGHRVKHTVLIAPTTPGRMKTDDNPGGDRTREELAATYAVFRHDLPHRAAEAAADFFGHPKNPVSQETMDWWCRMFIDRCSTRVLRDLFKLLNETNFHQELKTIRTPTLLLHGDIDKSAVLEFTGRPTHELIPGSKLIVYENAAHGLPYTHTDRMLADITEFASS